jgi:hypothetical protein
MCRVMHVLQVHNHVQLLPPSFTIVHHRLACPLHRAPSAHCMPHF